MSRLIDADELIEEIDEYAHTPINSAKMKIGERAIIEDCKGIINSMPTVNTEKHGHWVWSEDEEVWKCSLCELGDDFLISNYCKDCGAKMDEDEVAE